MRRAAVTLALLIGIGVLGLQAREQPTVAVLLTTGSGVSPAARMALMREATGIWARAGIRLAWRSRASQPTGLSLRVLTVQRTGPVNREDASILGELVRGAGTMPVAMIALDQAAAVAARAESAHAELDSEQRLGLILGRIVAHEIGHFLLAAAPHADDGLMRAHFPEAELTDPWSLHFELTAGLRAVAQHTVTNGFGRRVPAASVPAVAATRNSAPEGSENRRRDCQCELGGNAH